MQSQDYTFDILTTKTPREAYDAINNVRAWWSDDFKGSSDTLNDEFEVHFADVHHSKHKITELIPGKKITWLTTDSQLNFLKDKSEWTGTTITFEISDAAIHTLVRFTHHGLVPQIECFGDCSNGWNYFLKQSLLPFINTGKGNPHVLDHEIMSKAAEIKTADEKDFTSGFTTNKSAMEVYNAINNVRGWWSENIQGSTDTLGEAFNYSFKDIHRSKIKVTELVPGKKIEWLVLDNYFSILKDQNEWTGNVISFEISEDAGKTTLFFTHKGLTPAYECYEICFDAWTGYITGSLLNHVNTGKGQPNPKEAEVAVESAA
ncbi:MAG: hypothetical protein V4543_08995 [Bacteroidota bacterium]